MTFKFRHIGDRCQLVRISAFGLAVLALLTAGAGLLPAARCEVWTRSRDGSLAKGDGVLIARDGGRVIVLTAKHVLSDRVSTPVCRVNTWTARAAAVSELPNDDVAGMLLENVPETIKVTPLASSRPGRSMVRTVRGVASIGPGPFTASHNQLQLEWTSPSAQGDSGGPVVNSRGEVVSLVCASDGRTTIGPAYDTIHWSLYHLCQSWQFPPSCCPPVTGGRRVYYPVPRSSPQNPSIAVRQAPETPADDTPPAVPIPAPVTRAKPKPSEPTRQHASEIMLSELIERLAKDERFRGKTGDTGPRGRDGQPGPAGATGPRGNEGPPGRAGKDCDPATCPCQDKVIGIEELLSETRERLERLAESIRVVDSTGTILTLEDVHADGGVITLRLSN